MTADSLAGGWLAVGGAKSLPVGAGCGGDASRRPAARRRWTKVQPSSPSPAAADAATGSSPLIGGV